LENLFIYFRGKTDSVSRGRGKGRGGERERSRLPAGHGACHGA